VLFGWFIVGLSGGALTYLGTITAGQHELRRFAFTLRLSLASLLTGIVGVLLSIGAAVHNYDRFIILLTFFLVVMLLLGAFCYRANDRPKAIAGGSWRLSDVAGLGVVYVLFCGQAGFSAYVLQQAASRGLALGDAVWALTYVKLMSGSALLILAR